MAGYKYTSGGGGALSWIEVANHDFTSETVAAPAADGDPITVDGLDLFTDNGDGGAGRGTISSLSGTGLTLAPAASAAQVIATATSTRTATICGFTMADVGLDPADPSQFALILFKIAAFAPADNSAYLQVGWEIASAQISSGGSGRGELFGPGRSGGSQQFHEAYQDAAGVANGIVTFSSPPVSSSARVLAMRLAGRYGASYFYSNTDTDFDLDNPLASLTFYSTGTYRRVPLSSSDAQILIAVSTPSLASPAAAVIQGVRVLLRGVA